ncbi:MAG: FHA domain-containing protein [Gemmatimonadetes bacterium]|nr:FHA domain-containing protein [Gemmatimonadota bacterium]
MPYLQFRDQRVTLSAADQTIGAFDGAALRVPGDDATARAIVRLGQDGTGIILRGDANAVVMVNGVMLGAEPSPLLHGDKVEIGGHQLHYGEDAKGGSTQFISAASLAEKVKAAAGAPKKPTSATGGRLVSLVDGREYAVPDAGVTFGREIGNDIVIASGAVSRRHATIAPTEAGYVIADLSTNGVLVNGIRVTERQVLGRGDVIRIGEEEFRFYADKAKEPAASAPPPAAAPAAPAPAAAPTPPPPPAVAAPAAPPVMAPIASRSAEIPSSTDVTVRPPTKEEPALVIQTAMDSATTAPAAQQPASAPEAAAPAAPAAAARTALATLEVINEGPMKGTKYEIFTPLTNIGRGAHNDIAIKDDSISDSHAKILRKDGHWYVADQGSTNGTYVGGRRIQDEQQLVGAPDVRFGNIKVMFKPTAAGMDESGSTKAIAAVSIDQAKRMSSMAKAQSTAATPKAASAPTTPSGGKPATPIVVPEPAVPEKKKGCAAMIAFIVALGAAGAGMLAVLLTVGG